MWKRTELGQYIKQRRQELRLSGSHLARAIGWDRQRLHAIEAGISVSQDIKAWIRIADALDLSRKYLLARVWQVRDDGLALSLPEEGDPRRELLLDLAIEQHLECEPLDESSQED